MVVGPMGMFVDVFNVVVSLWCCICIVFVLCLYLELNWVYGRREGVNVEMMLKCWAEMVVWWCKCGVNERDALIWCIGDVLGSMGLLNYVFAGVIVYRGPEERKLIILTNYGIISK